VTTPAALLLVHGAGSGPWVFDGWAESFDGIEVAACDLQGNVDPAQASMQHYADAVVEAAQSLPRPVALCGWSMGGLVALLAAAEVRAAALVLLEPSPPAEVQGADATVDVEGGLFDPETVYGRFPDGVRARPESARARSERKRGISAPTVECRALVVYGDEFREERGTTVAALYGADERHFPGLRHWDLVRSQEVRDSIARWLAA
jgi:pimeloyl-ACP methyl ester carboxylesterase